jgi:peptidoglycan/xylan/chitin deacetylase (PgdA/CDA1 family)
MVKLLGSLAVWLFDLLSRPIYRCFGKKKAGTCVILYYHVVTPEQRGMFAGQMDLLAKLCVPVSTDKDQEFEEGVHHAAVTFDDGFTSVVRNALPELESRGIPITIFVPSGWLGQSPCWEGVEAPLKAYETVVDQQQLTELSRNALVSIGSHCISHPDLPRLGEREAGDEILRSRRRLQEILGDGVRSLSFPFGAFNDIHVRLAREAGYSHVFTTSPELLVGSNRKEFVVGRVKADPTDWPLEFRLKVLGAYRWLPFAFSLKRRLKSLPGRQACLAPATSMRSADTPYE